MHHMIGYIRDEPELLARTFVEGDDAIQHLVGGVRTGRWGRLVIVGVGSSYTAALMAVPAFRLHCPIPVEVMPSTELTYYQERWLGPGTVVLSVSRSGERGWVVEAQRAARAAGAYTVAMTGIADSLLASEADLLLPTSEGPEITFSKTKSVITCAGLLTQLALRLAPDSDVEAQRRLSELEHVPELIRQTIRASEPTIAGIVPTLAGIEHVSLCGSAGNFGVALEGGIKIQETSFVPTRADDTGNCLHGVLGTSNETWLLIALVGDRDAELSRAVLHLAGVAGAQRMAITAPGLVNASDVEHVIEIASSVDPVLAGLVYLPCLQLLTYYLTLARNKDPDAPSYMKAQFEAMLPEGREEPELRGGASLAGAAGMGG
jgi:glucosamine--fructose-6-phosphate aminotransferase (isomerizing)